MWQNNGLGNGNYPGNNFNQEKFPPSPFAGSPSQQHFFHPQPQLNQLGMQFDNRNDEDDLGNGFQPEVGLSNEGVAFPQNPQLMPPGRVQHFSVPQFNPPSATPTPTLNTRAAELKAQLLKGRRSTSQPPAAAMPAVLRQGNEGSSSLRGSPQTPVAAAENEKSISDLISEFSEPKRPKLPEIKTEVPPKSASITNKANGIGKSLGNKSMNIGSRDASNGSMSEVSEGEIVEEVAPPPSLQKIIRPTEFMPKHADPKPAEPKSTKSVSTSTLKSDSEGAIPRRPREEKPSYVDQRDNKPVSRREIRPDHKADPRPQDERRDDRRDDRREEVESRPERRSTSRSEYEQRPLVAEKPRREIREHIEENRRSHKSEEIIKPVREAAKPTLAQVLPHDEDLREWLEITGYHNEDYRNKILQRRRKLAKLDAEKAQLLAEMALEERGGVPAGATPAPMAPPPGPASVTSKPDVVMAETKDRARVVSNKRTYSEVDEREEGPSKISRTDDRGDRGRPIKQEDGEERQRSQIGYDSFKRDRSYPRDFSPGQRAYENRPPARSRDFDEFHDDYKSKDTRPFEVHGGYRGRAYDPHYRGRGRGISRGRGDFQGRDDFDREFRGDFSRVEFGRGGDYGRGGGDFGRGDFSRPWRGDSHMDQSRSEGNFGTQISNSKPYKDFKGFSRGGRGETRYFIVKSFNEENVMKCIEDSVWTTQLQNGDLFKEAFETCKNVILVFSINKSKAFQGYARMESLPGSVTPPQWQKAITWESAGAFKVRWLIVCSTRFHRIGHLKNALNDNQAVLIGKDGQEIEENCGAGLIELIDEEYEQASRAWRDGGGLFNDRSWDD